MAGVDATMFFVLDVLRNIGGEGTRNLDGKLDHRRHRSSCPIMMMVMMMMIMMTMIMMMMIVKLGRKAGPQAPPLVLSDHRAELDIRRQTSNFRRGRQNVMGYVSSKVPICFL